MSCNDEIKFHLMYPQASSSISKLYSLETEPKLVEANTNAVTEFMCNTFSVALPTRECGKFRPIFNSFLKPANTYACELGAHPSVIFSTNKISEIKTEKTESLWILCSKFYSTEKYN